MRFINKGAEPESFTTWKSLENDNWKPSYSDLANPVKRDVYNALLTEQEFICCYCERELTSGDYHLEHLDPQSLNREDDLSFNNFLCSCLNQTAKGDPLHCGKEKANAILPVHPLQADCQLQFTYTGNGKIKGKSAAAEHSIKILALDLGKLNDYREKALEPFLDPDLSDQELVEFVNKYIENKEAVAPFLSAVEAMFEYIVENIYRLRIKQ